MPCIDLPLVFPSRAVISMALGDLLGSTLKEVFSSWPGPPQVISLPRMTHRHFAITSLGASSPSDFRLTNFQVPSSPLASLTAVSSATEVDAMTVRMTPASRIDHELPCSLAIMRMSPCHQ